MSKIIDLSARRENKAQEAAAPREKKKAASRRQEVPQEEVNEMGKIGEHVAEEMQHLPDSVHDQMAHIMTVAQKSPEDALGLMRPLMEAHPESIALSLAYVQLCDYSEVIDDGYRACIARLVAVDGRNLIPLCSSEITMHLTDGNVKEAIKLTRAAVKKFPDEPAFRGLLIQGYLLDKKRPRAIEVALQAAESAKSREEAVPFYLQAAMMTFESGKDGFTEYFDKACDADFSDPSLVPLAKHIIELSVAMMQELEEPAMAKPLFDSLRKIKVSGKAAREAVEGLRKNAFLVGESAAIALDARIPRAFYQRFEFLDASPEHYDNRLKKSDITLLEKFWRLEFLKAIRDDGNLSALEALKEYPTIWEDDVRFLGKISMENLEMQIGALEDQVTPKMEKINDILDVLLALMEEDEDETHGHDHGCTCGEDCDCDGDCDGDCDCENGEGCGCGHHHNEE